MIRRKNSGLSALVKDMKAIADEAQARFGVLTVPQLNWKPSAEQWSVGQIFDHLIKSSEPYRSIITRVASGQYHARAWERISPLSGFWGRVVLRAVSPESPKKIKAPRVFQPSSSSVDDAVVRRFVSLQFAIAELMARTESLNLDKIIITSPVSSLFTYSLFDAYRILNSHGRRHLSQAQRLADLARGKLPLETGGYA